MPDDVRAWGSHHFLGITLTLAYRGEDSGLRRAGVAYSTVLEDSFDELFDLNLQSFISEWLVQNCQEFLVSALETSQKLVSDELAGDSFLGDVWGLVGSSHRRVYDIRYIKPYP